MNHESMLLVVFFLMLSFLFTLTVRVLGQQSYLRLLDKKLDALLKAQGVEWSSYSPEVRRLALDPRNKIAAIKLHRDENPSLSIAEAKVEIEALRKKG